MGPKNYGSPVTEREMTRIAERGGWEVRRERGEASGIGQVVQAVSICFAGVISIAVIIFCIAGMIEFFTNSAPGFIYTISVFRAFDSFMTFAAMSVGNYVAPMLVALCIGIIIGALWCTNLKRHEIGLTRDIFIWFTVCLGAMACFALMIGLTGGVSSLVPVLAIIFFGFFVGLIGSFWIGTGIIKSR